MLRAISCACPRPHQPLQHATGRRQQRLQAERQWQGRAPGPGCGMQHAPPCMDPGTLLAPLAWSGSPLCMVPGTLVAPLAWSQESW